MGGLWGIRTKEADGWFMVMGEMFETSFAGPFQHQHQSKQLRQVNSLMF